MLDKTQHELNYNFKKKETKIYKTSYYFICKLDSLADIGLDSEVVPKGQLQKEEVDWAGFVDYSDAKKRLGKVFLPLLKYYELHEDVFQFPVAIPPTNDMRYIKSFEDFVNDLENNKDE